MNTIKIETGHISGTTIGEPGKEVNIYRGIPYAAPPVGDLRWRPPQEAVPWEGIRECTVYSKQPAQLPDINTPKDIKIPTSEDCLYLNVLTPARPRSNKLPVMVWFHGGVLRYGSGNWTLYNNYEISSRGVVLVTVNTRLGIFGLMAHSLLSKESENNVSGNYLFLDMIASLKWIKRNIAAFGGDPDNVTIFGESGGGIKVVAMIASPLAKGLFHGAIAESGGAGVEPTPLKDTEELGERLFAKLGVGKEPDPLAAARAIEWEKVVQADQALAVEMGGQYPFMGPWTVVKDDWFISDTAYNIFQSGKQNPVPFILVANMGELTGPGFKPVPKMAKAFSGLLSGARKNNINGYAAVFDKVPANWRKEGCVASHAMEMHYVFGAVDDMTAWKYLFRMYALSGAKSPEPAIDDSDRKTSDTMVTIWTEFAKTGNPSVEGLIDWPVYDEQSDQYLYISDNLEIRTGYSGIGA